MHTVNTTPRALRRWLGESLKASSGVAAVAAVAAVASLAAVTATPAQAADVGVSVSISQPGVYGRVDIGRFPQPELVVQQPVIIQRQRYAPQPVYMWVPPVERANWGRYCGNYRACGTPVYFVRDEWYGRAVRPHGPPPGWRHDDRREWRDDRRRERWDDKHDGRHDNGLGHGRDDDRRGPH